MNERGNRSENSLEERAKMISDKHGFVYDDVLRELHIITYTLTNAPTAGPSVQSRGISGKGIQVVPPWSKES
jgi:hypothetical protein